VICQVLRVRHTTDNTHSTQRLSVYTERTYILRSLNTARVFCGHDHSWVMLRSLTSLSAASGDLSGVALIAPWPGPSGTVPSSCDAASPVGPG
jgi:hypothetical protein